MKRRLVIAVSRTVAWALVGVFAVAHAQVGITTEPLARWWDESHVALPHPPLVTHAMVEARLAEAQRASPDLFSLERIGESVGTTMQLPDWSARPAAATIAVGQPAHLFLLESDDAIGTYRVVRVLRIGQVAEAPPARH
jgi:hypothetical protein